MGPSQRFSLLRRFFDGYIMVSSHSTGIEFCMTASLWWFVYRQSISSTRSGLRTLTAIHTKSIQIFFFFFLFNVSLSSMYVRSFSPRSISVRFFGWWFVNGKRMECIVTELWLGKTRRKSVKWMSVCVLLPSPPNPPKGLNGVIFKSQSVFVSTLYAALAVPVRPEGKTLNCELSDEDWDRLKMLSTPVGIYISPFSSNENNEKERENILEKKRKKSGMASSSLHPITLYWQQQWLVAAAGSKWCDDACQPWIGSSIYKINKFSHQTFYARHIFYTFLSLSRSSFSPILFPSDSFAHVYVMANKIWKLNPSQDERRETIASAQNFSLKI